MRHRDGGAIQEVCPIGHVLALQATFDMIISKKRMTPKHDR